MNWVYRFVLLALTVTVLGLSPVAFSSSVERTALTLSLPKNIADTVFTPDIPYHADINGIEMSFTGVPFLKDNVTYIPVRDIANAFGVGIEYNTGDRTVSLLSTDRAVIIMPQRSLQKKGSVIIKKNGYVMGEQEYLLVNNRSYIPLRYVMESMGYSVKYDESSKVIVISGVHNIPTTENPFFTQEQQLIIKALSKFEGETHVSITGEVLVSGKRQAVQAEITKQNNSDSINERTLVFDGKYHYNAISEMLAGGTLHYSLSEITSNNVDKPISLIGWGANHPYFNLIDTGLSGIQKYRIVNIKSTSIVDGVQIFSVTTSNDSNDSIEIGIDVLSQKLKMYAYKSSDGFIDKKFMIKY